MRSRYVGRLPGAVLFGATVGVLAAMTPTHGRAQTGGGQALGTSAAPVPTNSAAKTIVVESYLGTRPEDANQHVGPVLDELRANGAVSAVGEVYEAKVSQPRIAFDSTSAARFIALAKEGYRAWTDARFEDAIGLLEQAADIPAAILTEETRDAYRMALVGLSLAHKRLGHANEAMNAMAELVRAFPGLPLHPSEFGSEASSLYDDTRSSLVRLGVGHLSVGVDDPDAIVTVNGQYIANPERIQLVAGLYRVVARKRKTHGRTYVTLVEAGKSAAVQIAWALDEVIHTSSAGTGFRFRDPPSSRHLGRHAAHLGRLLGATTVVVVGIAQEDGRRSVVGKVYAVGRPGPLRTASVAIEPVDAPAQYLAQLGAYLAGATKEPPPRVPHEVDAVAASSPGRRGPPRALLWSGLGAGLVAAGTGVYFLGIDGEQSCDTRGGQFTCPKLYETTAWGYGLLSVGTVAVVGSTYLLWRGRRRSSEPALSPILGPARGIGLAGTF